MKVLTAAEMREVDRLTTERDSIPSLTLMENAGRSVAEFIRHTFPNIKHKRVVVLCGQGNNGGDGFVVARLLYSLGAAPTVFLAAAPDELRGDAAANLANWQNDSGHVKIVRDVENWKSSNGSLASADVIVDALLGTGVRGPVEGLLAEIIQDVNRRRPAQTVVAVDIPSGLPADTGEILGPTIRADFTVTFTAPKVGMLLGHASDFVGQLVVCEIGSPADIIEEVGKGTLRWSEPREFSQFASRRRAAGNKGDYGHALIVAGSLGKSGAAVLASWSALRVGAGLVTAAIPENVLPLVAGATPEIMTVPLPTTETGTISSRALENQFFASLLKGKSSLGIGPGLSTDPDTQLFVRKVVADRTVPIVLDADGLNAFAGRAQELKNPRGMLAITPHPGEMGRLLSSIVPDVQKNRIEIARKSAADWNAHVILKGSQTVVATPDGTTFINSTGNPGMATAGTGDVLTGMLAGLTAQFGADRWPSLLAFGVYLHGLAADIAYAESGEAPLMASDLIHAIPGAYRQFYAECGRD
jgi:ADP-dependent NAD(P)H-hydrate dehydratase / NAD(P)H-hydrate epimerase